MKISHFSKSGFLGGGNDLQWWVRCPLCVGFTQGWYWNLRAFSQFIHFSHLQSGLCPPDVSPQMFWGLFRSASGGSTSVGWQGKLWVCVTPSERGGAEAEGRVAQGVPGAPGTQGQKDRLRDMGTG